MIKKCLCSGTREFFLCGARLAFGSWLLYLGAMKWIGGASGFVGYISTTFAETWAPAPLVVVLAWIILISEPLLGTWLLSGKCLRLAWFGAAKLMFILMFGQTMLGQYETVANNWQYLVFALACAALTEPCCKTSCQTDS